jgi:flagella basal body P-ring formation protein FlgA
MLFSRVRICVAAALLATASPAVLAAPYLGPDEETISLNTSAKVSGDGIKLGDIFGGHPVYEDTVVAPAPAPGERIVLDAAKLQEIARKYDVAWHPIDGYERAVVYRAGRQITAKEILAAFKADLVAKGMPANIGLQAGGNIPTFVVAEEAVPPLTVREGFYDPITKAFSAVAEIVGMNGKPQYLRVRGTGFTTIAMPVLKEDAVPTKVITADMIETVDIAESLSRRDMIADASGLIGKSPTQMIRAGRPVHTTEVARLNLVDVPVLKTNMDRDDTIHEGSLTWVTMNAAALPGDVVTTKEYLIGKSPRRMVAASAPIRRGDVRVDREIVMAVAARDLQRGEPMDGSTVSWVPATDETPLNGVIVDQADLAGRVAHYGLRAGQQIRAVDVERPTVVAKDKLVTIIFASKGLKLTVRGKALESGGAGQTIRVANANSKSVVLAEVIDENTVQIIAQQIAAR